jgi:hypothetical protein
VITRLVVMHDARVRPLLVTVATTVLGLLPLV